MKSHYEEGEEEDEPKYSNPIAKKSNVLPLWGNERSMNLNPLILTNIQSSHYFKVNLYELKTYHEVIDEIYYKVAHLEPWEKGSRKTAGQTGMCGGVRGVGAGGIVSTAYCLLYKLFTLKLTRKQLNGLITHADSPYIRALGFMYIRYTQPPADLWDWYDEYLDDPEELDVKAGGGQVMTMGNILKTFLCKLEWFSTLFPRIPVPIQQKIERNMNTKYPGTLSQKPPPRNTPEVADYESEKPRHGRFASNDRTVEEKRERVRTPDRDRRNQQQNVDQRREFSRDRERPSNRIPQSRDRERDRNLGQHRERHSRERERHGREPSEQMNSRERERHGRESGDQMNSRERYGRESGDQMNSRERFGREFGDQMNSRDWRGTRDKEPHQSHSRHNGDKRRPRSRSPNSFRHKSRHH